MRAARFTIPMLEISILALMLGAAAGCKNKVDTLAFKSALNNYYSVGRQECLWTAPIKFPVQADTEDDQQTKGFDALTDAGMLVRTPVEKKRFLIGSKQMNDYDLSSKGRTSWTADASQPGYGNFCFGHPQVISIDSYSPADDADATQYTVNFHYADTPVPDWANNAEIQQAFPNIAATSAGRSATATLVKNTNGWEVTVAQPPAASGN